MDLRTSMVDVGEVSLEITEAGDRNGRCVVLAHGFPESSHSWRHQMPVLAEAGWHVIAPNQRGYGGSGAPREVDAYGNDRLCADLVAVAQSCGHETAVFVGHDWGAFLVWDLARLHPQRCEAVVGLSVPLTLWPMPPTELFRAAFADRFFYMSYFQQVGPPERELEANVERTLRTILWGASGEMFTETPAELPPMEGTGFLDIFAGIPDGLPGWIPAADFEVYVRQFRASGFFGPVSWYRNLDANHERVRAIPTSVMTMPTFFIGGARDRVISNRLDEIEETNAMMPDYRGSVIIPDAGHWTQQEAPDTVNEALLGFLAAI